MNPVKEFKDSIIGRPNTIKTQVAIFGKQIAPYLPCEDPKTFLHSLVVRWQAQDLKPTTINVYLGIAAKYLEFKNGYKVDTRRLRTIISRMSIPSEVKCWDKTQAQKALRVCQEELPELYLALLLTLHTGLRIGEAKGLKWGDIDIFGGNIKVMRSYEGPTKSGKPRVIPFSDKLATLLEQYYIIGHDDRHVCTDFDWNHCLRKLCAKADIPKISWHGLRHSYATLALRAKVDPRLVQDLLGHSNLTTTLNLYWHVTDKNIDVGLFVP